MFKWFVSQENTWIQFAWVGVLTLCFELRADLGFSRGGGGFSKKFPKFWRPFFLGRSDWFSELSQSSKKTLFWQNFLRRMQFFEKTGRKTRFWALFGKLCQKKNAFGSGSNPWGGRGVRPPTPPPIFPKCVPVSNALNKIGIFWPFSTDLNVLDQSRCKQITLFFV